MLMAGTGIMSHLDQPGVQLYHHSALTHRHEIRLLKLTEDPGTTYPVTGRIRGELVHKSLDDIQRSTNASIYFAISYFWGDPSAVDQLWLSETEYVPITASASYILRRVTRNDYLWIDSVCINQSDNLEKAFQVQIMWGIYKYAERVLAWLGGPEDNGDIAMELLFDTAYNVLTKEITGRKPISLPTQLDIPGLYRRHYSDTALSQSSYPPIPPDYSFDIEAWTALAKFLNRPWFRRAWVIQEIVAAKDLTLYIGREHCTRIDSFIGWKNLTKIIDHLEFWGYISFLEISDPNLPCDRPVLPAAVECMRRINALQSAREDRRTNFQNSLLTAMAAEATDPRDKVFALGSMSEGSLTKELVPNYELSVQDVYMNATRHLLLRDQYILALHVAGIGWGSRLQGLPSWVPDYSKTHRMGAQHGEDIVLGRIAQMAIFNSASGYFQDMNAFIIPLGSSMQTICLNGIIVDKVEMICRGLPPNRSIWRSLNSDHYIDRKVVLSWVETVRSRMCAGSPLKPYVNGKFTSQRNIESIAHPLQEVGGNSFVFRNEHALASALVAGSTYDGRSLGPRSSGSQYKAMYNAFVNLVQNLVESAIHGDKQQDFDSEHRHLANAYIRALDRLPSWTVFRTTKGYIGRGPPLLKEGDKVCVFEGGRTPFIIRRAPNPLFAFLNRHHLVGECYVEGLMRKEALSMSARQWGPIVLV